MDMTVRQVEDMTPQEYVEYMWEQFDKDKKNGSDYVRWRNPEAIVAAPSPIDDLLSEEDRSGRRTAMRIATQTYSGLEEMWRGVVPRPLLKAMSAEQQKVCSNLHVALFPTYSVDAKLTFTPKGDRLVLIHRAMSDYLVRLLIPFAKVLCGSKLSRSDQESLILELRQQWNGERVDEGVMPTSNAEALVHAYLLRACEQFIVGHEFGHAIKQHSAYSSSQAENHKMEYEADEQGARLLFSTMVRGIDSQTIDGPSTECYGLLAPVIVLGSFSLIAPGVSHTHPDPLDRMMTFIENYQSYVPEKHTWPDDHLRLVLRNVVGVAQAFYKWSGGVLF